MATKLELEFTDEVSETLLIPLWARALEQRESQPLVHDPLAAEMVERIDYDWRRIRLSRGDLAQCVVRLREFDRFAREFLVRCPTATVAHIGCGLDARFQRVDNGRVRWFDLDLPEVIAIRRRLLPESEGDHYLACSVFDQQWMDAVDEAGGPFLFMSEAVLPYFGETQVRGLIVALQHRFPESELVTDACTPLMVVIDNLHLVFNRSAARMHWGLREPRDVEGWSPGIRLAESFYYFDRPEPRMGIPYWFRHLPGLARGSGIHRYRLGTDVPGQMAAEDI